MAVLKDNPAPYPSEQDEHYRNISAGSESEVYLGERTKFEPSRWLWWFNHFQQEHENDSLKALRRVIQTGTSAACYKMKYEVTPGKWVNLYQSEDEVKTFAMSAELVGMAGNKISESANLPNFIPDAVHTKYTSTTVRVLNCDCLLPAIEMKQQGMKPLVLNMASFKRPGGGYRNGAGAQEENIFRRSNYFQSLEDPDGLDLNRSWHYPLPEFGGVYSPGVTVFRGPENEGYPFLSSTTLLDFIAVPAYAGPKLIPVAGKKGKGPQEFLLNSKFTDKTRTKIRIIFNTALQKGNDCLVLSAFGCGAFSNPPNHIAAIFKQVICHEYAGCFKQVVFAILGGVLILTCTLMIQDDKKIKRHNPIGNFVPFLNEFEGDTFVAPRKQITQSLGNKQKR